MRFKKQVLSLCLMFKGGLFKCEEGPLAEVTHFDKREDIEDWIKAVVVIDQTENVEASHEERISLRCG